MPRLRHCNIRIPAPLFEEIERIRIDQEFESFSSVLRKWLRERAAIEAKKLDAQSSDRAA
jgi:Arc/MetJ-type ribon-helix-helix transcriptional regulator